LKKNEKKTQKEILLYISGVGLSVASELGVLTFIGIYVGKYLDQKFSWNGTGLLLSVLFFLGAGLVHIVFVLINMQKKLEDLKNKDAKGNGNEF